MIHKKILISSTSTNFKPFALQKTPSEVLMIILKTRTSSKPDQLLASCSCLTHVSLSLPHGPHREGAAGRHCMCSWGAQSYRKKALVAVPANKQKDTRMWARESAWDRDGTQRMPTKPHITRPTSTFLSSPCSSTTVTPPPSLLPSSSLPPFYFHTFP